MAMTRETKFGVGVSFTFVCLVGLILGCRLYEEQPEEQQATGGPKQVAAATPPGGPLHPPGSLPAILQANGVGKEPTPSVTPAPSPGDPVVPVPTPSPMPPLTGSPAQPPTGPAYPFFGSPAGPNTVEPPAPPAPPVPSPPAPTEAKVVIAESVTIAAAGVLPVAAASQPFSGLLARIEFTPTPVDGKETSTPPAPPAPVVGLGTTAPPVAPPPLPPTTEPNPPIIGGPVAVASPPAPPAPPVLDNTHPLPPTTIPAPASSQASATLGAPTESKFVRAPEEPTPVPAPAGSGTATVPPTGLSPVPAPPETKVPIIPAPVPGTPTGRLDSPGGNVVADVPMTAPAPPGGIQVASHPYRMVKVEKDASFQELSGWYYKSDKYALDLAKFNRDNGGPVESAAGKITAPQTVYFPDVDYFEKPQSPAVEARPVAVNTRPMGKVYQAYEVAPGGESWLTIAQGRLDRADEIKNLNPTVVVNAQGDVPAGTLLKLPAD